MVILHYTGMATGEGAEARLCHPASEVSSHYLVHEDGMIVQMVPEARRAWHAGAGSWRGEGDINSRSLGIEIVNPGHEFGYRPFPPVQIAAVIALGLDVVRRHAIAPERILAHSDVAPARKADPGELFPWDGLAAAGLGHWCEPEPVGGGGGAPAAPDLLHFQRGLAAYGYEVAPTGRDDEASRLATIAFQRHFRPARVDGIVDRSTAQTLARLAAALEGRISASVRKP